MNYYDTLNFEGIIENILNNTLNSTFILEGNDLEIYINENISLTLITTKKERSTIELSKTNIDLNECENLLKVEYNISLNTTLFIFKFDIKIEGMKIPKIEYELYYFKNNNEIIKLNLNICKNKNKNVFIYNPVNISDDIDIYNKSSDYYNDICSKPYSNKIDLTIPDRRLEFVDNNMTLCEEDCDLIDYNYTTKKAKCSCLIKIKLPLFKEIKFDKEKLLKSFVEFKNFLILKFLNAIKKFIK